MVKKRAKSLAPDAVGVKTIAVSDLVPNPHNPRTLFDREPLDTLRASIAKVGILVPLTVYWDDDATTYVILDGQRRWMCAKELALPKVPVNHVAKPTLVQNIVTMFQIHKLREDWELMPTALKLEVLMGEMRERNDRRLAELTGLDRAVVSRCKKLLSYPRKYQDMMLDPDPEKREKADFFIELYSVRNDRFVNQMPWYSNNPFTQRMLEKYRSPASGLKAVTDFRLMKQHINNARKAGQEKAITKRLREFTEDDSLSLDHLVLRSANVSASARALLRDVERLAEAVRQIDVNEFYGEENLWRRLEQLMTAIRAKLVAAGRRLTQ